MDVYLGYIYETSKSNINKGNEIGREKRKFIINLRNDDKFREVAIGSIEFYLDPPTL